MRLLVNTAELTHDDWLDWRRKGIGGSDAAKICGFSRWGNALDVYLDKLYPPEIQEENEFMYWGNVLEDIVAKEFSRRTGLKVRRRNAMMLHDEYSFMLANIDRELVGIKEGLECKTASAYKSAEWENDEIPIEYIIQCQHYMAVTDYKAWWIAVLIGGNKFVYKKIERDEEIINFIINKEREFWEKNIEKNIAPPIEAVNSKSITRLYPESTEGTIALTSEIDNLLQRRKSLNESIKQKESEIDEIDNKVKAELKDVESGESNNFIVKWTRGKTSRFDSKTFCKENPDLVKDYMKEKETSRFTVREKRN